MVEALLEVQSELDRRLAELASTDVLAGSLLTEMRGLLAARQVVTDLLLERCASMDEAAGTPPAKEGLCPHGLPPEECNDCMVEGDFAYDAAREQARFR